jgi:hypothetical protein
MHPWDFGIHKTTSKHGNCGSTCPKHSCATMSDNSFSRVNNLFCMRRLLAGIKVFLSQVSRRVYDCTVRRETISGQSRGPARHAWVRGSAAFVYPEWPK